MRLPPNLLHRVRLGIAATALWLPGCDAAANGVDSVLGSHPPLPTVASAPADSAQPIEATSSTNGGLGAQIAEVIATAEPAPLPPPRAFEPVAETDDEPPTPADEDVTAFVPFSSTPGASTPGATTPPSHRRSVGGRG